MTRTSSEDTSGLPPLYARWITDVLDGPIPAETVATCDTCVMCSADTTSAIRFDAGTKCCTYVPILPNFSVGEILLDDDPAAQRGRQSVIDRIERRAETTPHGLTRSRAHELAHAHVANAFGRARSLRCPHYVDEGGGRCGVWRHRNAVCASWFCKHVRGATGFAFWRSLESLLEIVEGALSTWCLLELGMDARLIQRSMPRRNRRDAEPDPEEFDDRESPRHREIWGSWHGRERELYIACARSVAALEWRDVERIGGIGVALHRDAARAAHRALLDRSRPRRVRSAVYRVVSGDREQVRLRTYSDYDPIEIPRELAAVLGELDAPSIDEGLARIADAHGLELTDELVVKLVDFGVLVDASEEQP